MYMYSLEHGIPWRIYFKIRLNVQLVLHRPYGHFIILCFCIIFIDFLILISIFSFSE